MVGIILGREICNVAIMRILNNYCGRYDAVWLMFDLFLFNFVVVDICYNLTGRSAEDVSLDVQFGRPTTI